LMLAVGGRWLENIRHAAKAYSTLMTVASLNKDRQRAKSRGLKTIPIMNLIGDVLSPRLLAFEYQLAGSGQKRCRGQSIHQGLSETRAWLEAKLGPLALFGAVEADEDAADAAAE
jgi:hypothetical protein